MVKWIVADVTEWEPSRQYDLWHDRAAFHFLTEAADRAAYLDRMRQAIRPGGHAIIATFAIDGPDRCSGLPVMRYDATLLSADAIYENHLRKRGESSSFSGGPKGNPRN
jgi:trans-aconitate methyltransferase